MPKPEVPTSSINTRSKKEKVMSDPKQLPSEIKTEIKPKTIIEKSVVDLPVAQKVQSVKETTKTDVQQFEKKIIEQSLEEKIEQSIEKKIEQKSLIEECSIIEKNKSKKEQPPSSSEKDECSILDKNKSKKDELSTVMKDETLNIVLNIPKEKELSPSKKDESISLEKTKPEENLLSLKKDESLNLEKNKPKETKLSTPKKDESISLEKTKPEEDLLSPKKDEFLNLEKNKPKETKLSTPKKDESISLEKTKPEEDLLSPKKDEFLNLEKNKPKETKLSTPKKDESISLEKTKPEEDLLSLKKDESLNLEKNKPKETKLSTPKKDESISLEKTKPKESKLFFIDTNKPTTPSNVAVPRKIQPYVPPISNQPPIVLATHLVPSLPIGLFEVLAEMIEVATERPVVLLYEPRTNRKVASEYTDIAILPASDDWENGELMPVSFVFKHKLNNNNSPQVYADVVVASDLVHRIEKIVDLRGHRCALPDRSKNIGAATLIYNYLHSIGEGPAFFGNTLDVDSQIDAMQMVAGKQAEVGILEAPVITCHKYNFPGIQSLYIVDSLGPLPPYRFMINKKISGSFVKKLTSYLLNCNEDASWMMKLAPFGITGFAANTLDYYVFSDVKPVFTRGAYY